MMDRAKREDEVEIYGMDDVEPEGVAGHTAAGLGTVAAGEDEKTPFLLMIWVILGIGVIVSVVMALAFLVPYLTTGNWPY